MAGRLKRSSRIVLTTLMAGTAVSITACGNPNPATDWDASASDPSRPVQARAFDNLEQCKATDIPAAECEAAYAQATGPDANIPKYADAQSCEDRYGVGQCAPRSQSGGGSFFTPLLAGFLVGQMMNGGGYRGAPVYRDRDDNYTSGGGAFVSRNFLNGRSVVQSDAFNSPSQARARSPVISRGGFGIGSRSFGG